MYEVSNVFMYYCTRRISSILIIGILLILFAGCNQDLWIEVSLGEDHPWEAISGRRFWYTVVYLGNQGLEQHQLSIGVRSFRLPLRAGSTTVIAAYPLGQGLPFGGAYHAHAKQDGVRLTLRDGPLAKALLHIGQNWFEPVSQVNFHMIAREILYKDVGGISIDWNHLGKALVKGELSSGSIRRGITREIQLSDVMAGHWIAETPHISSFYAFSSMSTDIGELPPGIFRYLNNAEKMELRIVVPDDATQPIFWHIVPVDAVLSLSDAAYQQLLERRDDFP